MSNALHSPHIHAASPRCTVLVVDDHESTREMLGAALQIHGFDVELVENGVEALDKLADHHCQVVLTDYWMPEMNGVELLIAMRARPDLAVVPIILMTAAHGALPPRAQDADAILKKPFDSDALLRALSEVNCKPRPQ